MYPRQHFLAGILLAVLLFFIFPAISLFEASIIVLSTVLIDADHYLFYVFKKRDLNLKRAILWYLSKGKYCLGLSREHKNKHHTGLCIFHGIESLILLWVVSFWIPLFFFIFVGAYFHLLLDVVSQVIYHDRFDRISVIYDFFKFKKLKYID